VAQGRAEAILGLQAMGFDPDAADALRDLIEGKEQTRALAVERITGLLGRLGEAHAVIVLGVILEMLRETDSAALQHNLLLALHEAVPLLARREDYAQDTIRLGIKGVQLHHARLAPPVRNVLAGLGRSDPERTVRTLWQELDRVRNHRARVFLLSVLEQIGPPARLRKELAAAMAAEIVNPGAPEAERLLLAHNLASLGEAAVPPLLEALESREVEQKPFLIPFFDILCAEKNISASAKNHVARALLSHLKAGDRRMRIAIVQSWLCCSPDVEAPLRRGFAAELIQNLDEFDHPDVRERIEVNLDRIGEAAVDPLFDFVKQHPLGTHRDPRKNFTDHLVRILATILARAAVQTKTAHARTPAVLEFCIEQIKNDQVRFGGYAVAAATLCAPEAMGPERGTALVALLKERLPAVAYPADVLTGLGVVASADQIALRQKIEVAHIYLRLVAAQRRAPVAQARQTADGVVYEFGKDSELDSVMLPAAVVGAGMVCTSESTSPALRQMVIEQLLAAWREATSWKVTWGPLSAEKLASTLGMLGAHLRTPVELKLEIAHTLKDQAAERLSVVRAMGEICSQPADLKELNEVGLEVADAIMQGWLDIEIEPEERRVVLTTLARIAARNELDRRSPRVKRFRERVLNLVFDAFRERLDGARTLLEILSKCQSLAKNQQREIEERLRTFYAVAKAP
jgi:hypothetical protein